LKRRILRAAIFVAVAIGVWVLFGYLSAQSACAHDPRFVCSPREAAHPVLVPDAAKSWAYYGGLRRGQRDTFVFTVERPLDVPWQLLVDRRDAANTARPQAVLSDVHGTVATLSLTGNRDFYEPFSRLSYIETPDFTLHLKPGSYVIDVSMDRGDDRQRYVMAIGSAERFGFGEIPYVLGAIGRIRARRY
jgi:hypothetical protein